MVLESWWKRRERGWRAKGDGRGKARRIPHLPSAVECLEVRALLSVQALLDAGLTVRNVREHLDRSATITGATIVTHGFQPFGTEDALKPLALALRNRADLDWNVAVYPNGPQAGTLSAPLDDLDDDGHAAWFLNYQQPDGSQLEDFSGDSILPDGLGGAGGSRPQGELVLLFDWAVESNNPSSGWTEAAGDALFSLIVGLGLVNPASRTSVPLHFIGHSFGAAVTSEAVERLAAFDIPVDHVTYLDPHDFNQSLLVDGAQKQFELGQPDGYGATVWNNVTFADVYYQTESSPHGRPIPGAYNILVNDKVSGLTQHSQVWNSVYLTTVNNGAGSTGYAFSRLAQQQQMVSRHRPSGSFSSTQSEYTPDSLAGKSLGKSAPRWTPSSIVHGNFRETHSTDISSQLTGLQVLTEQYAVDIPGWQGHGTATGASLSATSPVASDGNRFLPLDSLTSMRTHNRMSVPADATELSFDLHVTAAGPGERLVVQFDGASVPLLNLPLTGVTSGYRMQRVPIPADQRGRVDTLTFRIEGSGSVTSSVRIDNLGFALPEWGLASIPLHSNTWTLRRRADDGGVPTVELLRDGLVFDARPLDALQTIRFSGTSYAGTFNQSVPADESFIVDLSRGNPLPAGGLTLDGRAGSDTLRIDGAALELLELNPVSRTAGTVSYRIAGQDRAIRLESVENVVVSAAVAAGTLQLGGSSDEVEAHVSTAGRIQVTGSTNSVWITDLPVPARRLTIRAGEGHDRITLYDDRSVPGAVFEVLGEEGQDTLTGGAGADWLNGGSGNDQLLGGDGDDVLRGRSGDDLLDGGAGHDRLQGDEGRDTLRGGPGDDTLDGGASDDDVQPGPGQDRIQSMDDDTRPVQPAPTIELVSIGLNGQSANGSSNKGSSISADGRFVAFSSDASNIVSGDTNGWPDIFVRDMLTGTTTLVSVGLNGQSANRWSYEASISADGRFVAFHSFASNLVSGDTNGNDDIFVRDMLTGVTTLVSVGLNGLAANGWSEGASISADGRHVAFSSNASNLVSGDTNGEYDVFVRDMLTGTTTLVSVGLNGQSANHYSEGASISADGRFVAFLSYASNLVSGDTNGNYDIFVRDMLTGTTTLVSVGLNGQSANGYSDGASISADGRFVAFESYASNLVSGDTNGRPDAFVRDMLTGTTTLVSVDLNGQSANRDSDGASISADGRFVAFLSYASNLVSGDTNGNYDIFVRDMLTGTTTLVSVDLNGQSANGWSYGASISADGRFVAFSSDASNLVVGDNNNTRDVFRVRLADLFDPSGVQGDSSLTLTLPATAEPVILDRLLDQVRLRLESGRVLYTAPLAQVSRLTLRGQAAAERLIVDLTGGNPLPAGGLVFSGGSSAGLDTLELRNTRSDFSELDRVAYALRDAASGTLTLEGRTLEFSGVGQLVDPLLASHREVRLDNLRNSSAQPYLFVQGNPATGDQTRVTSGRGSYEWHETFSGFLVHSEGPQFTTVDFSTPSQSLTLHGSALNDTIDIHSVGAATGVPTLTVLGHDGHDQITLHDGILNRDLIGRFNVGGSSRSEGYISPAGVVAAPRTTVLGGSGNDTLHGSSGRDWLEGGDGHDLLRGFGGGDRLLGQAGRDTLDGGDGDDRLDAGAGDDVLIGGRHADTLFGSTGDDTLLGGDGHDSLSGEEGHDLLLGEAGADTIDGGSGSNRITARGNQSRPSSGDRLLINPGDLIDDFFSFPLPLLI